MHPAAAVAAFFAEGLIEHHLVMLARSIFDLLEAALSPLNDLVATISSFFDRVTP
jgi:hypothetical protein